MDWWWAYLVIGVSVGFLAGLLGIGGGMIMVPMLVFVFTAKAFPADHMMHLALATSMATIVFTSISSVRAHHQHGAVDWRVARAMAPGIVAGALAATLVAGFVPTRALADRSRPGALSRVCCAISYLSHMQEAALAPVVRLGEQSVAVAVLT